MRIIGGLIGAALVLCLLMLPTAFPSAQSPTATATATRTATLTNQQLLALGTVSAPPQCGNVYVPCGPLPYQPPQFPTLNLPSPTVIELSASIPTSSGPTNTPGGPTSTVQPTLDRPAVGTIGAEINGMTGTLGAMGTAYIVNGTPVGPATLAAEIGVNAGIVFGYAKAFQDSFFNISGTIGILLLIVAFMLFVVSVTTVVPLLMKLAQIIMQLIETITP
jgi:hypothetical protein